MIEISFYIEKLSKIILLNNASESFWKKLSMKLEQSM